MWRLFQIKTLEKLQGDLQLKRNLKTQGKKGFKEFEAVKVIRTLKTTLSQYIKY